MRERDPVKAGSTVAGLTTGRPVQRWPALVEERLAAVEALAQSNQKELAIQFQRMAQIQAEVDHILNVLSALKDGPSARRT